MPKPAPIDDPSIRDAPDYLEKEERNAFYESLSPDAKDRFLRTLRLASARGMSEEAAWEEAVVAAETTYNPLPVGESGLSEAELPRDERDANL